MYRKQTNIVGASLGTLHHMRPVIPPFPTGRLSFPPFQDPRQQFIPARSLRTSSDKTHSPPQDLSEADIPLHPRTSKRRLTHEYHGLVAADPPLSGAPSPLC